MSDKAIENTNFLYLFMKLYHISLWWYSKYCNYTRVHNAC